MLENETLLVRSSRLTTTIIKFPFNYLYPMQFIM